MTRRPNNELTTNERRVLAAYQRLTARLGEPPSLNQLATELKDITRTGVAYVRDRLVEKGALSGGSITIIRPKLTAKGRRAG